jgi:hypothetical protein
MHRPGRPGWGLNVGLKTPFCKIFLGENPHMMLAGEDKGRRSSKYKGLRIGPWKMVTLYRSEVLRNLIDITQEYNIDILTLQEIHLTNYMAQRDSEGLQQGG